MSAIPRSIIHLDLDAFFVSVERVLNPSLKGRPVIVAFGGRGALRSVVSSASYEARASGVHSAMPLVHALRLCRDATVLPGNPEMYSRASHAVFGILKSYAPLLETASIDEAYLDVTGTTRLFGPPADLSVSLVREIKERLRLDSTVGLATNKLVSKVASELAKPRGFMDVMEGEERDFLAPLMVSRLPGVGPVTEKRLLDLNIQRIGELAETPEEPLAVAFGKMGMILHKRALGIDPSPVEEREEVKTIGRSETFASDSNDFSFLSSALYRLIEDAASEIRQRGLMAGGVTVSIRYSDFVDSSRSETLGNQTDLDMDLFETSERLLKRLFTRRTLVRLIGVRFFNLSAGMRQMNLFGDEDGKKDGGHERRKSLIHAVDVVRSRYGNTSVFFGRTWLAQDASHSHTAGEAA